MGSWNCDTLDRLMSRVLQHSAAGQAHAESNHYAQNASHLPLNVISRREVSAVLATVNIVVPPCDIQGQHPNP
jgi:hypothetical protein